MEVELRRGAKYDYKPREWYIREWYITFILWSCSKWKVYRGTYKPLIFLSNFLTTCVSRTGENVLRLYAVRHL